MLSFNLKESQLISQSVKAWRQVTWVCRPASMKENSTESAGVGRRIERGSVRPGHKRPSHNRLRSVLRLFALARLAVKFNSLPRLRPN